MAGWVPSLCPTCSKLSHQALNTDLNPTATVAQVPAHTAPGRRVPHACPPLYPRPAWHIRSPAWPQRPTPLVCPGLGRLPIHCSGREFCSRPGPHSGSPGTGTFGSHVPLPGLGLGTPPLALLRDLRQGVCTVSLGPYHLRGPRTHREAMGRGGTLSSVGQTRVLRSSRQAPASGPPPRAMALAESPSALSPGAPRTKLHSPGPQASRRHSPTACLPTPTGICQHRFLIKSQGPLLGSSLKPACSSQPASAGPPLWNPPALPATAPGPWLSLLPGVSHLRPGAKGSLALQHNPCEFSLSPSL